MVGKMAAGGKPHSTSSTPTFPAHQGVPHTHLQLCCTCPSMVEKMETRGTPRSTSSAPAFQAYQ